MTFHDFVPVIGPGVFGLVFLGYGLLIRRRGKATLRWRPVQGKIVWSMLEEREVNRVRGSALPVTMTQYRPDVRYRYTVGGVEHECAQIYVGDKEWHKLRMTAQPTLDKYPVGRELRVFHNPANSEEAVLERGAFRGSAKFLLIGSGALSIALIGALILLT